MFNYNHLYYFYTVVKEGGISPAARKLNITQPALSAQIKQLEKRLKKKLFEKDGRGLKPTDFGVMVYGYARNIFELANELSDQIVRTGGSTGVRISIGVSDEIEWPFAVDVISALFNSQPGSSQPRVTLLTGTPEELESKLRANEIDAVFSNQAAHTQDVAAIETLDMPVMLGIPTSKDLPASIIDGFKTEHLELIFKEMGLVMPTKKFRLRYETDKFLETEGLPHQIVFESDMLTGLVRAVGAQLGASFMPLPYFSQAMMQGDIKAVGPWGGFWRHKMFMLTRSTGYINPLVEDLKKALSQFKSQIEGSPFAA
jgi:LysR family transcriptional regulator, transcriptional activator of nhaA